MNVTLVCVKVARNEELTTELLTLINTKEMMLRERAARAPANITVPMVDSYDLAQAELDRIRSLINRMSVKKLDTVSLMISFNLTVNIRHSCQTSTFNHLVFVCENAKSFKLLHITTNQQVLQRSELIVVFSFLFSAEFMR